MTTATIKTRRFIVRIAGKKDRTFTDKAKADAVFDKATLALERPTFIVDAALDYDASAVRQIGGGL